MVSQLCVLALYTVALPMVAFAAPVEKNTPAQTGAFLAFCKSNDDGCISEVSDVSFAIVQDRSWCPTSETDDVKILTPKWCDRLSIPKPTTCRQTMASQPHSNSFTPASIRRIAHLFMDPRGAVLAH